MQKTVLSVMLIMTAGKLAGLLREILIGGQYGTATIESEAFGYAIQFPNIFMDVFFASAVTASFIPIFSGVLEKNGKEDAFRLANAFMMLMLGVTAAVTALLMIMAPLIIRASLFFAGTDAFTDEVFMLAVPLLRILLPNIVLTGAAFCVTGILQSMEQFRVPAAMSLASNLLIITYLFFFVDTFGILGLAAVFLLGWGTQVLIQLPALRKKGFSFNLLPEFRSAEVRRGLKDIGRLMLPVMVSSWAIPINVFVNSIIAGRVTGVAAIRFAYAIFTVATGILVLSASNVLFTRFSKLRVSDKTDELGRSITASARALLFVLLPLSAMLFVLAPTAISVIYERGAFTPQCTYVTGNALRFFALGMAGFGLMTILSRGFFACRDGKTPLIASLVAITINAALSLALVERLGTRGPALAFSVSITAASLILFGVLAKKKLILPDKAFAADLAKMLFLALTAGLMVAIAFDGLTIFLGEGQVARAMSAAISALIGALWYIFGALFLRIKEATDFMRSAKSPSADGSPRILMVTMSLNIGGAETHILELCRALHGKGVSVRVASAGGKYADELVACGIPHHVIPLNRKSPWKLLKSYRLLKRLIRDNNIDVVHAHARIPAFICGFLCRRLKMRFVTTAHWVFKTNFPYNLLSNWGQAALAVSDDIKDYLVQNYDYEPGRIIVTINGVDTEKFAPGGEISPILQELGLDADKKRIVSISRLDDSRALAALCLCKAAAALDAARPGELEIIIVGDGDDFDNVKKAAAAANEAVGRRMVVLTGNRTDVSRILSACDIFVNVSRSALEAMAAAKPVILAGNEGYMGLLTPENQEAALLSNFCCRGGYPQTTPEFLTRDILAVLDMDGAALAALGDFGREFIKSQLSVGRMADDAMALYALVSRPLKRYDAVLSGYYGDHNSGDDLILSTIIDAVRRHVPGARVAVLCRRPRETAAAHGVKTVYAFNPFGIFSLLSGTNLLISGGGTLITDNASTKSLLYYLFVIGLAKRLGCKTMIYSSGVGPFKNERNRRRAAKTLHKVDLITLRDEISMAEVQKMDALNLKPVVIADAVFALPYSDIDPAPLLASQGLTDKPYYCVSVRAWKTLPPDFVDTMAHFVRHMSAAHGLTALFVPMQPSLDLALSQRIIAAGKSGVLLNRALSLDETLALMKGARFVAAMRLHALIYAAKVGTPVIGLSYDPKIDAMIQTFAQTYCAPVESVTAQTLNAFAETLLHNRDAISADLSAASRLLAQKAEKAAEMAGDLIKGSWGE